MLATDTIAVSLAEGLDSKSDPKQLKGSYLYIQNAIYQTLGQLKLRYGFQALTATIYSGGSIAAGNSMASLNQSQVIHDGTNTYSRIGDLSTWTLAGQKTAVTTTLQGIGSGSASFLASVNSALASNGLELYVWVDYSSSAGTLNANFGASHFSVFDTLNNVTLFQGLVGSASTSIRADVIGSNFFITKSDGTNFFVYKQPIATPNFGSASATNIATDSASKLDTCVSSAALYVLGTKVYRVDAASLAVTTSAASYGPPPTAGMNYDATQNNIWVISVSGTNIQAAILSSTLTVVKAATTVGTVTATGSDGGGNCLTVDNNQAYAFVHNGVTKKTQFALSILWNGTTFTSSQSTALSNSQMISKPIKKADGNIYYATTFTYSYDGGTQLQTRAYNPDQPTSFLLKATPAQITGGSNFSPIVVARALSLEAGLPYMIIRGGGLPPADFLNYFSPANLLTADNGTFSVANTKSVAPAATAFNIGSTYTIVKSGFVFGTKIRRDNIANNIQFSGGYLSGYDGSVEVENNFHLFPEILTTTITTGHPSGLAVGSYNYVVVERFIDAQGQVQQSSPSDAATVVIATANSWVDFTVAVVTLTDKSNYWLDFYRTTNNGGIYYLLESFPVSSTGVITGTLRDSDPQDQVSTIQLYTTGGILENTAPPAPGFIADFANRLFMIPSEHPYSIQYSQPVVPNTALEMSGFLTIDLEARGGPATALANMDDKLVILKQAGLFYMVGDGPSQTGANNNFSNPQSIPTDSGCVEPSSVVSFPLGVIYKGAKGIYLLDRSLNVEYIGAPVESYNQFQITSAIVDSSFTIIRFSLSNGISLVYDYYVKKWDVFTNVAAVDAIVQGGVYNYLKADGTWAKETPNQYSDLGSVIPLSFITSWIQMGKVQGYQRLKNFLLLGTNYSACVLTVSFAYDFNSNVTQTVVIPVTSAQDPWQERIFNKIQKCEAVQLTITMTPSDTSGQGLALSNINAELGIKKGFNKMAASKSSS
jgi:hypothetical protein